MDFVDLNRCFAIIGKDEEANLDIGRTWGRKIAGWLDWPDLLKSSRVVLLAEASSGKTEEFRHQAETLAAQGKAAFFVRIEDLADEGFEAALDLPAVAEFETWRAKDSIEDGWFFLDSVDEARLNHKSLDRALRHFRQEVNKGLERAHVYVSCRVSDWKGREDRDSVERILPVWRRPAPLEPHDQDEVLLAPIFNNKHQTVASPTQGEPERDLDALLVVQLIPLNTEQRQVLASTNGANRSDEFVRDIEKHGLDALAERPGDLLDLAKYWRAKGCFGSLTEMTDYGVTQKLAERDKFRPDNKYLSPEKARHGVERIAAALTMSKSFTLRAPGHDPDPTLAVGALDPAVVLDDWSDAERNTLLRRGIFAPSTYGRIRFHHRGTQEYLIASWLKRLLDANCPRSEVWNLLFADLYKVKTLVPSLHGPSAWLARHYPEIRNEIIIREPLVLLRYGDPRSLPLDAKERLLLTYASRHAVGEISNDSLDYRSLWMFATPALGSAIREAWSINDRIHFRIDLLHMIIEGRICACADLARGVALDAQADENLRIAALDALATCEDVKGLVAAAQWIRKNAATASDRLGSGFARVLFPKYLKVDQLLDVIGKVVPPKRGSSGHFSDEIVSLWGVCPDYERERFIDGIANLVLAPPLKDGHRHISARHNELAANLASVAIDAASKLRKIETSDGFLRLLMAVERAESSHSEEKEKPLLCDQVSHNPQLKRRLFWADVMEMRKNRPKDDDRPIRHWEMWFDGGPLWKLGLSDIDWLTEDVAERQHVADKRVAFSAIFSIFARSGCLDVELPCLRQLVSGTAELEQDLEEFLRPAVNYVKEDLEQQEAIRKKREKEELRDKASWMKFRDELVATPSILRDPACLTSWPSGVFRLHALSRWLRGKTQKGYKEAPLEWRLLEEGFDRAVAEAYRDGMEILWRVTPPERPEHKKDGMTSVKYTTILSFTGVDLEAAEDPDWASRLTATEVERAALHGCLSEQGYPEWIEELVNKHETVVLPILRNALISEWKGRNNGRSDFFSHYGWRDNQTPIQAPVQQIIFKILTGERPTEGMFSAGLRVLRRLELSEAQRRKVVSFSSRRFRRAYDDGNEDLVLHYLIMLFLTDPDGATREFAHWVSSAPLTLRDARCLKALSSLFGRDSNEATSVLRQASIASIEVLVRFAYQYVRHEDDRVHEDSYNPDVRDLAEDARNTLLTALFYRPGAEAYYLMRTLSTDPAFRSREIRFNELARAKAEQDAELPVWMPSEVLALERQYVAPAKTGEALLRVVMGTLDDIQLSFHNADATSRALLQNATNEDEVQKWLAEQLNLRARGRYHAHREAQIARRDKPDIIVSSASAQVEIAIEVKHGGMGWSVRDFEKALKNQLVEDYLKPVARRHGVLFVSMHSIRTWRDPDTKATLTFNEVIERLQTQSSSILRNKLGPVEVRVFGLDCLEELEGDCL